MSTRAQRQHRRTIRAAAERQPIQFAAAGRIDWIEAADAGDAPKGPPKFSMLAYTGGPMIVGHYGSPVILDMAGGNVPDTVPILMNHDLASIVGHSESADKGPASLKLAGVISGAGPAAAEVAASARNGFPWKASVGARPDKLEFVGEGVTTQVNGKTYRGPLYVARKWTLGEVSFVAVAADGRTSAKVAATAAAHTPSERNANMNFEQWVQALGFDLTTLTDAQKAALQAKYDGELKAAAHKQATDIAASGNGAPPKTPVVEPPRFDVQAIAVSHARHETQIEAKAAEYAGKIEAAKLAEIKAAGLKTAIDLKAKALQDEWAAPRLEVEFVKAQAAYDVALVRAERPTGPAIHASSRDQNPLSIEAAFAMSAGLRSVEKEYKPEVLEAAAALNRQYGAIGLQTMLLMQAHANGYDGRTFRIHKNNCRDIIRAAFSTASLPGILSNVANKFILDGFMDVEQVWREFTAIRPVNDFKTMTSYRMTDNMLFEEIGPTGEIAHGEVGEESYTNRARTYAKMFSLTREMIINDDLGAFDTIRSRLGRGYGIKLNQVFWATFLNDAAFFTAPRGNLITAVLGEAGIGAAELALNSQTDAAGNPIDIGGVHMLLTGAALNPTAKKWYVSQEIRDTTASTKTPTTNIYQNTYRPVKSRYVTSATAWYLLPVGGGDMAPMEVCFLDGQQNPTVESADADFDTLGIQFRGYGDFGCARKEWRAAVKSTGAG